MPKLPDVSGYSFDELSRLVSLATKRMGNEIWGSASRNCKLSLAGWVLTVIQRRGVAVRMFGPMRLPHGPLGGVPTALEGRLRHSSGAPMAKSTRDEAPFPNGLRNWAWMIAPV